MSYDDAESSGGKFERWLRNAGGALILLLMTIIGNAVTSMQTSVTEMEKSMSRIDSQVSDLRADMSRVEDKLSSVYTEEDARRDFLRRDQILRDHDERLRYLEGKAG